MSDPFDTGQLPPGLREGYLAGMQAVLGVLAGIGERLAAAGNDREALEMLQREAHKVHGSAGSYGFMDASRLAAGMEVTAKDWVAHSDDREVDRGSLTHWFVARLAEMLGLQVPPVPPRAPPRPPAIAPRPMLRVGPPPRPSQAAAAKPTQQPTQQPPQPASRSVRAPAPPQPPTLRTPPPPPSHKPLDGVDKAPPPASPRTGQRPPPPPPTAPTPPRPQVRPQPPKTPTTAAPLPKPKAEPPAPSPTPTALPWIVSPEAVAKTPAAEAEPVLRAPPAEPVAAVPPAAAEPEPPPAPPAAAAPPVEMPAVQPQATSARPAPAPSAPPPAAAPRPAAEAPVAAAQAAASDVPEVIFVEDDAALAELLAYGLRARGYRFAAYRNGREALRELIALDVRGNHPLLLLDVDLPALDGYSIFAALQRERPGTYRVVFTTVHGTEEEQLRGLEAGALDYLVKPMSLRVALEKIKRWVGR